MTQDLLEVRNLVKKFPLRGGFEVSAVNGVSFSIAPGESVGLVGESGSGKSTLGMLITRLTSVSSGQILFAGDDITQLPEAKMRRLRSDIQIVFQDPWGALNPRMTVGHALGEPLLLHSTLSASERDKAVKELAARVHLPSSLLLRFPHELSGGQLQRISIARAIATKPRLLVLDEPTSSLDLSVRAGILAVLDDIRKETGVATLLISHDLETVELMTDRVLVLYLGRIVEQGETQSIFAKPVHPYTQTLLSANLPADPEASLHRYVAQGEIPSPINLPPGCLFASRCPLARADCGIQAPNLLPVNAQDSGRQQHAAACIRIADGSNWLAPV